MPALSQLSQCVRAVDPYTAEIVRRGREFCEEKNNKNVICGDQNGKKQFIDIMEAAQRAHCVEELKLYVAYKGAKEGSRGMWNKLANPLNHEIDELENIAKIAKEGNARDVSLADIHHEIVKRYMGYLMWQACALLETRKREASLYHV
ncbi:MAG: hypothetical protein LBK75_03785 [Oscillospiraceae bacterium]|jgi:hypothetical protein|nr:hypothetical protein [Oscillospiraceae bacterium]